MGVISRVVASLVAEVREVECEGDFEAETYLGIGVGLFRILEEYDSFSGFALYISDDKRFFEANKSLYSRFKFLYKVHVGTTTFLGDMASFGFFENSSVSRRRKHLEVLYNPFLKEGKMTLEEIKEAIDARIKLVSKFELFANKSLNHRRVVSKQLRYFVLQRDNSTCQVCGRRAPQVAVHIDHKIPVSWDLGFRVSNDPEDYQVLCEDCNLGKGNMMWVLSTMDL